MLDVVFDQITKRNMLNNKKGDFPDVVCIGFSLDIGNIACDIDSMERKKEFIRLDYLDEDVEKVFATQREDFEKLVYTAKTGEHIRVWKSNAPHTACGFAFLCDALRDINCNMGVIICPNDTGLLQSLQYHEFLALEKQIDSTEKQAQGDIWHNLKIENAPLRALVNGKLISVPENFYDHIITKNTSDNEFVIGELLGNIAQKYNDLCVIGNWYLLRIKKMINENKLEIVSDKDPTNPLKKTIRKVK